MEVKKSMWKLIGIAATIGGGILTLIADEMERRRVDEEMDRKIDEKLSKGQS